jgi:hypothetical protein
MKAKLLDLPAAVAVTFIRDMVAFFAEEDGHKRGAIAVSLRHALQEFQGPGEKALRLPEIKQMFIEMKGQYRMNRRWP